MRNSIKVTLIIVLYLSSLTTIFAQSKKINIYNPEANAEQQIKEALDKAKVEGKHVFIQVGGNWCSWCIMLHKFYTSENQIDSLLNANYVVYLLNYSKENKNHAVLEQLEFPQRFGFPVIVILDAEGKRLHTQNSVYLEEGRGYNKKNFLEFLSQWTPDAISPDNYKK